MAAPVPAAATGEAEASACNFLLKITGFIQFSAIFWVFPGKFSCFNGDTPFFLPDTAVLDPFMSVYKSGDELVRTYGGLEVQILVIFTSEGKF